MKFKSVMLLAIAIGCGLVAMLGVQQVLSGDKSSESMNKVKVFVAAQEIPAGMIVDKTMVRIEKWAVDAVPKGAVSDPKQFEDRAVIVRVFPGDLLLEAKLGEIGRSGASVSIPKGMRVITVPVNLTLTHSGLIQPGDRVDVLVTYSMRDPIKGPTQKTKTVLEDIQIFATDSQRDVDASSGGNEKAKSSSKNMSLLVTPQQAALLELATNKGKLQLALRHLDDHSPGQSVDVDEGELDGTAVSRGVVEAEPKEPIAKPGNVKDFLDQNLQDRKPEVVASPAPAKATWSITIYEKGTRRVEEIEVLPEQDGPTAEQPASDVPQGSEPPVSNS